MNHLVAVRTQRTNICQCVVHIHLFSTHKGYGFKVMNVDVAFTYSRIGPC